MTNPWFRMYSEFATDHKVQMLSESDQRRLVMLLCLRCNGCVTLQDEEVTFNLRISDEEWQVTKQHFIAKGFIDKDNNILNWDKRQFQSDTSRNRVAAYRARKKQEGNADVTLQKQKSNDVDTDTDTDTDITSTKNKRGSALPKNWVLPKSWGLWAKSERPDLSDDEIRKEAENFKDYWTANSNQAKGKKSDWEAAWRFWIRKLKPSTYRPANNTAEAARHTAGKSIFKPEHIGHLTGKNEIEVTDATDKQIAA